MSVTVCTLYEGEYHKGVAALINSLHVNGFTGDIYIGYRGSLPPWCQAMQSQNVPMWDNGKCFRLNDQINAYFLPVETDWHFTNFKPQFMLQLWSVFAEKKYDGIVYFDPDIVNKCEWSFYERWISFGVALVHEEIWNDMPINHPKRHQWMLVGREAGVEVRNNISANVNAGFVGVSSQNIGFLELWKKLMHTAVKMNIFDGSKFLQSDKDSGIFKVGDQDLFNLSLMCTTSPISEFGPEGMDFRGGGWLMSHAIGSPKPWVGNYLSQWTKGKTVSLQSKEYWNYANGIINVFDDAHVKRVIRSIKIVSFLSRFYAK